MKFKILEKFSDKYTGAIYEKGETADFTKKRAEEILSVGRFIEKIKKQDKGAL